MMKKQKKIRKIKKLKLNGNMRKREIRKTKEMLEEENLTSAERYVLQKYLKSLGKKNG